MLRAGIADWFKLDSSHWGLPNLLSSTNTSLGCFGWVVIASCLALADAASGYKREDVVVCVLCYLHVAEFPA